MSAVRRRSGPPGTVRLLPLPLPQEYALANEVEHPRNVYLRKDALTDPLDTWLATAFTPDRLEKTITAMTDAQLGNQGL